MGSASFSEALHIHPPSYTASRLIRTSIFSAVTISNLIFGLYLFTLTFIFIDNKKTAGGRTCEWPNEPRVLPLKNKNVLHLLHRSKLINIFSSLFDALYTAFSLFLSQQQPNNFFIWNNKCMTISKYKCVSRFLFFFPSQTRIRLLTTNTRSYH